jgi:cyclophilin family peptidyl-prolyl cis-trans isomerase
VTRRRAGLLSLLALMPVLVLAGCGGGSKSSASCTKVSAPPPESRNEPAPTAPLDPSKTYTVRLDTSCGSFTITLDPRQSPNATASFYSLAQRGFYDATIFHRIVQGFAIYGGDASQSGDEGPGYTTVDPPPADASYRHGTVAMAKTGGDPPGTGGSQFFVVVADDAALSPDYAVIGTVSDGLDVIHKIGAISGDPDNLPAQIVEIDKATAEES